MDVQKIENLTQPSNGEKQENIYTLIEQVTKIVESYNGNGFFRFQNRDSDVKVDENFAVHYKGQVMKNLAVVLLCCDESHGLQGVENQSNINIVATVVHPDSSGPQQLVAMLDPTTDVDPLSDDDQEIMKEAEYLEIDNQEFPQPVEHHEEVWMPTQAYNCGTCQATFQEEHLLTAHVCDPEIARPFPCSSCLKRFKRLEHLKRHERIHRGVKPYQCGTCGRCFGRSHHLVEHQRIHTGEKPFICAICERSFSTTSNLARHKIVHTGVKAFHCTICDKSYSDYSTLEEHIRIHTGERPFQCVHCDKTFNRKGSLRKHKQTCARALAQLL